MYLNPIYVEYPFRDSLPILFSNEMQLTNAYQGKTQTNEPVNVIPTVVITYSYAVQRREDSGRGRTKSKNRNIYIYLLI